jgi:hypothetical protein
MLKKLKTPGGTQAAKLLCIVNCNFKNDHEPVPVKCGINDGFSLHTSLGTVNPRLWYRVSVTVAGYLEWEEDFRGGDNYDEFQLKRTIQW